MVFTSVNELDRFQFHDASITDIQLVGSTMIWEVSAINAMTTNTQNKNPKDMCIESAVMTFEDVSIEGLEFGAYQVYNANRELIKSVEAVAANDNEYIDILEKSTGSYCYIYGMDDFVKTEHEKYRVCFHIDGGAGNFNLTFSLSRATVKWDKYSGEAWYEHPKWKNKKS